MSYELVTLECAIALYKGISLRTARAWVRTGKLPAAKAGRHYMVRPSDVAALLEPTIRGSAKTAKRESEAARLERQLAAAGVR